MIKTFGKIAGIFLFISLAQTSFCQQANIVVYPGSICQGTTFTVFSTFEKDTKNAAITFMGKEIPCYVHGTGFRGLIGVSPTAVVGKHVVSVVATDGSGNKNEYNIDVVIRRSKFIAEKISFGPSKQAKLSVNKIQNDQQQLLEVLTQETASQYWAGRFMRPIKGYVTSAFGSYRLYNGKRLGDHRGVDIGGNPIGAEIKAANNGIVAFQKFMPTLGSVIIIDHGQGIHTIYMHMSKILVSKGESVEKGQVIGLVGNTGLSNGPHLHWGLSVHDTRVDALEWVNRTIAE